MVKLMSWDMFLKPNQAAFFQVMHYLFRILDQHLNEQHQLNWTNIKSYLVVMPGGMKFINFVLDLVGFVVKELTKQREKELSVEFDITTLRDLNVQSMSAQNTFMKEYASAYIDEMKQLTARFRQCTQKIRDIFFEIAKKTDVDIALLLDDQFPEDFEEVGGTTMCADAMDAMDRFLAKQTEQKQIKESADNALRSIQKFFGTFSSTGSATANALISALNGISETIAENLDANDQYNESNEFITSDLQEMRDNLQQIETQVNDLQKNLNLRIKKHNNNISGNVSQVNNLQLPVPNTPMRHITETVPKEHSVLMKFVSTPPIKPEGTGAVRKVHVRLPLQDDFNAKQFETTCNNLLAPPSLRSARKAKHQQDQSTELNSTLNRSKIFDPMQLLRTINKKSKPVAQPNLSIWADSSNNSYAKSAAVIKVLDASLNVQNLSTFPSGRLDPLVPGPLMEGKTIPRLQLNDHTINDLQQPQVNRKSLDVSQIIQLPTKFDLDLDENDDLLNVSDSVLKDIPI
ncbi:hypothetical protein ACLKA7_012118 [Drosophila subpalustris]